MAEGSGRSGDQSRLDREQRERLVMNYYTQNKLKYFVDREVFNACFHVIHEWLDNGVLVPYMMKYGLIKRQADSERLTSPYYLPDQRRNALMEIAGRGGDNGYFILYMCIRESREDNPYGHGDAVKELEKCAAQRNVRPTWEGPPRDYTEPTSQQESGQDTTSTADLGTDHGGQPRPAASVQDVVESSLAKVQAHNLHTKQKQPEYVKPPYSSPALQAAITPSSIFHDQSNSRQLGARRDTSNIAVVAPVQETHVSPPGSTTTTGVHGNRFDALNYRGDEVERDQLQNASVPAAKGGDQYQQQKVEDEASKAHAVLVEAVRMGQFEALQSDARNVLFISKDNCDPADEESVKKRAATLVAACFNSRALSRTGVIIVGVHPDDQSVKMPCIPHWKAIQQTVHECVVRQDEEKDPAINLSPQELSLVKVSPVPFQSSQVVVITVHPDRSVCPPTSVYRCLSRDKNGKSKLEPVYRVVPDDLETTFAAISFKRIKDSLKRALTSQRK